MSPELWSGSLVTDRIDGWRLGAEWKLWVCPEEATRAPGPGGSGAWVPLSGLATENEKLSLVAPGWPEAAPAAGEARVARTMTRSPEANGWRGTNSVPAPSGRAARRPGCRPVRDPATVTERTSTGASEEKMIGVAGEASGVPGNGITWRADACAAGATSASVTSVDPHSLVSRPGTPRVRSLTPGEFRALPWPSCA
jgi:hypothetical protein